MQDLNTKSSLSVSLNHSLSFFYCFCTSCSPLLYFCVFLRTVSELEASHIENYSLGTNGEGGIFSFLWLNYSLHSSIHGPAGLLNKRITLRLGKPSHTTKTSSAKTFTTQQRPKKPFIIQNGSVLCGCHNFSPLCINPFCSKVYSFTL